MSESEIRRKRTEDPEMDAMAVIAQVFGVLDRDTAKRILMWAEDRYVRQHPLTSEESHKALTAFTTGLMQVAKNLNAEPMKVLSAMERVSREVESSEEVAA